MQSNFIKAKQRHSLLKKLHKEAEKEEDEVEHFMPSALAYRGCYLFSHFTRLHLSEQMRASGDHKHCSFVKSLADGNPINYEDVLEYKNLSKKM
jgi:hypothetical protein